MEHSMESQASIPWYIWLSVAGVTSAMIGVHWDISWHRSIGRDTFWTPPHLAIQLCGVIAGITCGYLILSTTFTRSQLRGASVNVLGFRGPLGAFLCAWGGFAMITSAPFDDWWHNAYGLDVKILSPPHVVLALGMVSVAIGAHWLIVARMNVARGNGTRARLLEWLFALCPRHDPGGSADSGFRIHSSCFPPCGACVPIDLHSDSDDSGDRFAKHRAALGRNDRDRDLYRISSWERFGFCRFSQRSRSWARCCTEVTQFIPIGFPLLVLIPAFALDLVWPRLAGLEAGGSRRW